MVLNPSQMAFLNTYTGYNRQKRLLSYTKWDNVGGKTLSQPPQLETPCTLKNIVNFTQEDQGSIFGLYQKVTIFGDKLK